MNIKFKAGYKYQTVETYKHFLPRLKKPTAIGDQFLELKDGTLTIKAGYAWDGPSGPVIDRKTTQRASLVHDALYQLMRKGLLDFRHRDTADKIFQTICKQDGVYFWLANTYYFGLKKFGEKNAKPGNEKPIYTAPKGTDDGAKPPEPPPEGP